MKNSFLIIILMTFLNSFSQESKDFIKSEQYYLTEIDSLTIKKYWENFPTENSPEPISIYLKNNNGQSLYEIKISELEFYRGTTVKILNVDNLKNVEQIIRLKSVYDTCCSNYYSTYLLKTKDGNLIELPESEYLHCDGPTPITEYRFPNQKFGIKNQILLTKSILNENYEVESIKVIKTYSWNGKTFELKK
ncbi:hypothetical protein [Mesoflavibacter sp. SCSIO 43206]|uniref:hypothetical protein n=1 Tax=Mesoflavibacter sp. SCSIO 43206 TaxID=2779362 RepID=UPI001CA9DF4F|nr:hypothetical protein [Mesoflavibacter sp. SCSIO 43206]UAB75596.1 hypothetical protein INR78_01005 [Mesoflavibacter sp. SCSIO 43206]